MEAKHPVRSTLRACLNWIRSFPYILPLSLFVCALLASIGCSRGAGGPGTTSQAATAKSSISADDVLQKMVRAYRDAHGYSDQAILRLSYEIDGERHQDSASISVRLARPNRARLQLYQADIACDGRQLMARITDDSSNNIDDQWLVRAAPASLSLNNLLDDTVLYDVVSRGLGRLPIQLELLLGESPLQGFLAAPRKQVLDERQMNQSTCTRISISTDEGEFVLWIDTANYTLRRFEYPPSILLASLPADLNASDVELVAEFDDAQLESNIEDATAFQLPLPADARQVRYFVRPPQPLPSNLFGQRARDFQFTNLDSSIWSSAALAGKIAVLHWYVDHPACEASLQQWEQVRRRFSENPNVVFLAVCVEPSVVTPAALRDVLDRWGVESAVVRDLTAVGPETFGVGPLPAVVVLDAQQTIQAFWVTYNPDLANQLPTCIEQLLAGEDLSAQALAQLHNDTSEYYGTLAAAGATANSTSPSAQTAPEHWQLTELWQAPFHEPGNMLVAHQSTGATRLLVLEEGRVVLELDENGRSVGAHRLPVPENESITHLRAAPDGSAFVAFSQGGRRAYWLDSKWQLLRVVPDARLRHDGIRDAVFLQHRNGMLLCVASAGAGLLGISSSGKMEWQLEQPQIQSLSVHTPSGQLVAADASGRLAGIDAAGHEYPIADKQGTGVFRAWPIQSAPGEGGAALLGLSYQSDGMRLMYGLDERFQALWEYQLPGDPFHFPTEFVTSGQLDESASAHWVIASADGAIHLLSADGRQHDFFFVGSHISGLQVWNTKIGAAIVVGTENAVTAWQLTRNGDSTGTAGSRTADAENPGQSTPIRSASANPVQ